MSRPRRPRRFINGVLLLDKPRGMSSNDALLEVRRIYQADKAGHTGTLDPLASGLLPICLGAATRLTSQLLDARKAYRAEVHFGAATATGDGEGEVIARSDPSPLNEAQLRDSAQDMIGRLQQVPPMHSAIKRDGRPLYELAREGIEVERDAREIEIEHFAVLGYQAPVAEIEVLCSKGTYIRTLAEDWAARLGQVAYLTGLRRVRVGPFSAEGMVTLEYLQQLARDGYFAKLDSLLLPPRSAVADWTFITPDDEQKAALDFGRALPWPDPLPAQVAVQDASGRLLGLAEWLPEGALCPKGKPVVGGLLQPRRWFGGI